MNYQFGQLEIKWVVDLETVFGGNFYDLTAERERNLSNNSWNGYTTHLLLWKVPSAINLESAM